MKIIISASGPELSSPVDPRFGRCPYFIAVDTDSLDFKAHANTSRGAMGGAGIQAGQFVGSLGGEAVITGNVGPNASRVLAASNLKVYIGASGTVRDAVEEFKAGKLRESSSASVGAHFGMGGAR
jgi:predicted Fe-Mo cluster-binding NifX family protein